MLIESTPNETAGVVEETRYPSTHECTFQYVGAQSDLLEPRVAAVELIDDFKLLAVALSPRDLSTQDDLVQEMCVAALECANANKRSYYKWLAAWRAKNYLLWWKSARTHQETRQEEPAPEFDDACVS